MKDKISEKMLGAKNISKGTMIVWVQFDTDEEVEIAKEWMKGKQQVKTLFPMTICDIEKLTKRSIKR